MKTASKSTPVACKKVYTRIMEITITSGAIVSTGLFVVYIQKINTTLTSVLALVTIKNIVATKLSGVRDFERKRIMTLFRPSKLRAESSAVIEMNEVAIPIWSGV